MPEQHLFEYAVIRIVPCVEREEFFNTGVILYCPGQKFLQMLYAPEQPRLHTFTTSINSMEVEEQLRAFDTICNGGAKGGPIGKLPMPSRFRWLTATRSTVVQTSPVHPGLCTDARTTLVKLYAQLVQ